MGNSLCCLVSLVSTSGSVPEGGEGRCRGGDGLRRGGGGWEEKGEEVGSSLRMKKRFFSCHARSRRSSDT